MTIKYKYRNPLENGYVKVKMSKKEHNKLFPKRKVSWDEKYVHYYNPSSDMLKMERFISGVGLVRAFLLFPVFVLFMGLGNFKELIMEYKRALNPKKYGSFSSDVVQGFKQKYPEVDLNICQK